MKKIGIKTAKYIENLLISNKYNHVLSDCFTLDGRLSKSYVNNLIIVDKLILKIPLQY